MVDEYHGVQSQAVFARARKVLARRKVQVYAAVRIGDPATTIVNFAKKMRCDELVMGTRGLGSFKGLVLGSVTIKVIHLAGMPVTVVA